MRPRVCAVSYLNTVPLVWGMLHGEERGVFDLGFALPSECADQLASGEADIGIVPVIEMARQKLEYFRGTGIACHGPVRSSVRVHRPVDVDTEQPLHGVLRHVVDRRVTMDPGDVGENVEPAHLADCFREHVVDVTTVADVAAIERDRARAGRGRFLGDGTPLLVDVHRGDRGSLSGVGTHGVGAADDAEVVEEAPLPVLDPPVIGRWAPHWFAVHVTSSARPCDGTEHEATLLARLEIKPAQRIGQPCSCTTLRRPGPSMPEPW